jgi:phosphoglucomutase
MILLNGNQTAGLLFYYILKKWKDSGKLQGKEFIVSTIVTTKLLREIAQFFGVEYYECLTGFKYIADVIRQHEDTKTYVVGGEESYGYLVGDFVRDKDAISACALIAETAAWMADQGKSLFDLLIEIYQQFGFFKEGLISVTRKGKTGAEEIQQMMVDYRNTPPTEINNSKVLIIKDYLLLQEKDVVRGTTTQINLPKSNVLQFMLEDGSSISVRPSGTEPKIKFYFGVREQLSSIDQYEQTEQRLNKKIEGIITSMKLK